MRYRAIKALGMTEIPDNWVRVADGLTEEEKRRFVIEDNVGFGEWDWDVLANEWDDLPLADWGVKIEGIKEGDEKGEFVEEEIRPFDSSFCFIKYPTRNHIEVQEIISQLEKLEGVTYEFGGQ